MKFKKGRKCEYCWGRGWTYPNNGDPVKDREECLECNATGYKYQEDDDGGLKLGRE
jgi:hypothetical protein